MLRKVTIIIQVLLLSFILIIGGCDKSKDRESVNVPTGAIKAGKYTILDT